MRTAENWLSLLPLKRWIFRALALLALMLVAVLVYGRWIIERQGAPISSAANRSARVEIDNYGVAKIIASDWDDAVEAQGFVVASERMFQMDLIRRFAAGRLAELFGSAAVEHDSKRRREDWIGVAERATSALDAEERSYCDAYAAGVNRFIASNDGRWGIEYALLDLEPEPWKCRDTMLVLMSMADQLTGTGEGDAARGAWKKALGEEWYNFLFTQDHPWNDPLFGVKPRSGPQIPLEKSLPLEPLAEDEGRGAVPQTAAPPGRVSVAPSIEDEAIGSNNWAYCGQNGCFLANDPHLGYGVPQTWFAVQFELGEDRSASGVSLPGIPGLVLGMNSHLAWAFTNVGEDVDDLLIEQLSPDEKSYLAAPDVWKPLRTVTSTIVVKDAAPVYVTARFTERGPLQNRLYAGWTARRWLVFEPGMLRLPYGIARSKNWDELNAALDQMKAPAQNVLMIDRAGNIGYRASGTGIVKAADGQVPQPAIGGNWLGFEPPSSRPRKFLAASSTAASRFIATANERVYVSPWGHAWADDARASRIREVLGSSDRLRQEDMYALQLDTESRFHRWLLQWIASRAKPSDDAENTLLSGWKNFRGVAKDDPASFKQALAVEAALENILIGRVKKHLLSGGDRGLPYNHRLSRAWMLVTLETKDGTKTFGVEEAELAQRLLSIASRTPPEPSYAQENAWSAQHPFADRVPLLGDMFRVATPPQYGSRHVPRVEGPRFGASVRMVWNLTDPAQSRWSFPVGQSGHVGSDHFDDARAEWYEEKFRPVFVDSTKPSR